MPLVKPGRWLVNPADIDPRYLGLWRGLVKLVPLWGGSPFEIIDRDLGTKTGGHVPGSLGLGFDADSGATNIVNIPIEGIGMGFGTILCVFDGIGTPADFGKLVAASTTDSDLQLHRFSSDTVVRFQLNSQPSASITVPDLWGTGPHVVVGTYDTDVNERSVWVDGVLAGTDTGAISPVSSWSGTTMGIGNREQDAARTLGGLVFITAFWDRVLSPAEIRLLDQDPFGMLRSRSLFTAKYHPFIRRRQDSPLVRM